MSVVHQYRQFLIYICIMLTLLVVLAAVRTWSIL